MSTPKKYLCKGCPGTLMSRPIPSLRDMSGETMNLFIRNRRRSDDAELQKTGERVCALIRKERCDGPQEQEAIGYDSEGSYRVPGKVDLVCGRGSSQITKIADTLLG